MQNKKFMTGVFVILCLLTGCKISTVETKDENTVQINLKTDNIQDEKERTVSDFSKGDLRAMFEQVNNESVSAFYYDDYNRDGLHEAFVVTEDKLWHITPENFEVILDNLKNIDYTLSDIVSYPTKAYLLLQFNDLSHNTLVYSIDNEDRVMEADISNKGILNVSQDGKIILKVDNSLGMNDLELQDLTSYYLYYQYDSGFREYGAIPIAEEQFMEYDGAEKIIGQINQMFEGSDIMLSFLYRSNNIINVNILVNDEKDKSNYNIVLKYDTNGVEYETEKPIYGKVETAYMLDIATYPTSFKHPIKNIEQ